MKKTTQLNCTKTLSVVALSFCMVASSFTLPSLQVKAEEDLDGKLLLPDSIDLDSDEEVSIIVELEELSEQVALALAEEEGEALSEEEAQENVEQSQEAFAGILGDVFSEQEQEQIDYTVNFTYTTIFNGAALTLPANKVEELLQYEEIKAIYNDEEVELIHPVESKEYDEPVDATMVDSIPFLGVNDLHIDGLTGEGIKIGVLDTGVDYNHPDLKDVYKGGYDFIDDDDDPMEATYDDWLASDLPEFNGGRPYYTNHGTHVSGTTNGTGENDSEYAVTGVAPDADLYAYRVLGPYGSGATSGVIAGIERSVEDGMDVINLSLGSATNNPIAPTGIATNNAVLAGVTVVTSAGNSGRDGLYTIGAPGSAALPISVGASNVPIDVPEFTSEYNVADQTLAGDLRVISESFETPLEEFTGETFELVEAGLGRVQEFADVDVEGKVAIVARGDLAFVDKIANAKDAGAAGVIIYNNLPGAGHNPVYVGASRGYIPGFSLTYEQGRAIVDLLDEDATVTFGDMSAFTTIGDTLADFSSRGPVNYTAAIKPEVVAPGVDVLSTVPSYMAGPEFIGDYEFSYGRASGTSMSSPHVAGIAALMLQANEALTPAEVKTKLMNTSVPLTNDYNVFEVGAGRVDPQAAIDSTMMFQSTMDALHVEDSLLTIIPDRTGALSFGPVSTATGNIRELQSLRISNTGEEAKSFTVQTQFEAVNGTLPAGASGMTLQTNTSITVPAGETVTSNSFLVAPKIARQGLYGGYMVFTNKDDSSEVYRVPFGTYVSEQAIADLPIGQPVVASIPAS
ncbi:S8 family serine peptidase [Shouchella sp. JSM 1781072]|uniref:S8 family serine peptidase n=1 Tax=Bacillaceae TaxID=186817 RepID=UPI0020D01BD7|nr:S8 family serine peptidase [Alkalihalobacillus sp. LMS6]UTR05778.1 S8 family serine peptidase [Alkalihalobacillus sp. LMS6]